MEFRKAVTRTPGSDFAAGITSVKWRVAPDYDLICRQHRAYTEALARLGVEVTVLPPETGFPDAYFVEDTAVIIGDTAVLSRPGAVSRMGEVETILPELKKHKKIARIRPPGLLDGGDVMLAGDHVYIGISERTNEEGARQLGEHADPFGFSWSALPVREALHLKSGVNYIGAGTLLMCDAYFREPLFGGFRKILVAKGEEAAANTLNINATLLVPAGHPQTLQKLKGLGMPVIELDVSEVAKMDGGVSCLSLRF